MTVFDKVMLNVHFEYYSAFILKVGQLPQFILFDVLRLNLIKPLYILLLTGSFAFLFFLFSHLYLFN